MQMKRWMRVVLVFGILFLAAGVSVFAYRRATGPVTLTVAIGTIGNDGAQIMAAIATRLASSQAPIRLKVVQKDSLTAANAAFASGEANLAIIRSDLADLSAARTVVVLTHGVLLLIAVPGRSIESIDDLKGKTVGIVGGATNRRLVDTLEREYDLSRAKVKWKDLTVEEVQPAIQSKQVDALLLVTPISPKYLSMIRNFFPRDAKRGPTLIPIESAGAIEAVMPSYESYDLPKGTLRGSPPIPDDDLTTLRVPYYLVANRKLDDDQVIALTKSVMDARGSLMAAHPLVSQISAPSTEKDAEIPIHPGAAAYFAGEEKTIFDKYGDQFFYASMILGMLGSLAAATWKFMTSGSGGQPVEQLSGLGRRIRQARNEELDQIEEEIDDILTSALRKSERGDADAGALQIALIRLGQLIDQRRKVLQTSQAAPS